MERVCTCCGAPIDEGEKFCMACGTPVEIKKIDRSRFCPQCGNLLAPDAMFCDVCGREAVKPKKEEKKVEPDEPATMDGLVSPVITEATFAGSAELRNMKFDGFESAEEHAGVRKEPEAEKPTPEPSFAMDSAALPERKEKPKEAPKPAPPPPPAKKEVTAESIKSSNPYAQYAAKPAANPTADAKPAAAAPETSAAASVPAPETKKKSGFAGLIDKILGLFKKK